jgi:hypothetical protein
LEGKTKKDRRKIQPAPLRALRVLRVLRVLRQKPG